MKELDDLTGAIVDAALKIHVELGPGLLESPYEAALMIELALSGLAARNQVEVPVMYRGHDLGIGFKADIIVENQLLLELKAVKELDDIHLAQTINYLKLLKFKRGYILNFNVPLMKLGIKRVSI